MRTIGEFLKSKRQKKRYSLEDLERKTKIRKEFILAIEEGRWEELPDFSVVLGFVKSLAEELNVDLKKTIALFRRDYPLKKEQAIRPPLPLGGLSKGIKPNLIYIFLAAVSVFLVIGFLIYEYIRFNLPPRIKIDNPKEGQEVEGGKVLVSGWTEPDTLLLVNNQPVLVDKDGSFNETIEILPNTNTIVFKATSRAGRETVVYRTIKNAQ